MADNDIDYVALNRLQAYIQTAVFRTLPGELPADRAEVGREAQEFFDKLAEEGVVTVRGVYLTSGIQANADFMVWWHAETFTDLQKALNSFRRDTALGRASELVWTGNGVHRPAEFNKRHLPAFVMGEEPREWMTVYPFVRSYEWYYMDAKKRSQILREHGQNAHDYADVRANTTTAFVLGDYEWMLNFEADKLDRIVDLMHQMRYTEARLHVRVEIPFYSGQRYEDISAMVDLLP
ncbi:chlorite dismutase family protein [Corynebacterium frankenforstense]|uniref:hydrogen peroxide-dependent heme synthase n=1 Tax=Corynebacterium TaxID=1716 RepID=UPI00255131EE|nr:MULTISPECIES: hydrogen peroxide-dependent heme synthase [Corynebacterium]MDK6260313.1 chlorite dismutase family protein [Corynebacterium frankenforstense]MDK8894722.1 chlorite dismutase family protein [Corynebacterium sp. MSK006]